MKNLLKISTLALACLTSAADAKVFEGGWSTFYFTGPAHVRTFGECLVFFNTGAVGGFADSGTWRSNVDPTEGGNFIYDNGVLRFYGIFNNGFDAVTHYATITDFKSGTGGFSMWFTGTAPLTPIQDGTLVMDKGCAGG